MSAVLSILLETQHQKILHLYFPVRKKGWKIFRQHLKEIQMQKKISVKILYCQHGIMFKRRIKLASWHCQEVQMWNARRQANTFWENKYFQKNISFLHMGSSTPSVCASLRVRAHMHTNNDRFIHPYLAIDL